MQKIKFTYQEKQTNLKKTTYSKNKKNIERVGSLLSQSYKKAGKEFADNYKYLYLSFHQVPEMETLLKTTVKQVSTRLETLPTINSTWF